MYEPIHEQIQVTARFLASKVEVDSFRWRSRDYDVKECHLLLKAKKGRDAVWLFYVSTDTAAFKIRFDTDQLKWWLEEYTWETAKQRQPTNN